MNFSWDCIVSLEKLLSQLDERIMIYTSGTRKNYAGGFVVVLEVLAQVSAVNRTNILCWTCKCTIFTNLGFLYV